MNLVEGRKDGIITFSMLTEKRWLDEYTALETKVEDLEAQHKLAQLNKMVHSLVQTT